MLNQKQKLALIDGDHILYIVCPNKVLRDEFGRVRYGEDKVSLKEEKSLEETIALCDNFIFNILNAVGTDKYIGVLSSRSFRHTVKKDYKLNREGREKPPYFDIVKRYLLDKYNFIILDGFEADDVVLALKNYYTEYISIIVTTDKDLLMLPGDHYNSKKVLFVSTSEEEAFFYFWESMIAGDTADNIKGIPGIGPIKARSFLSKIGNKNHVAKEVLGLYMDHFGESKGIQEFYMNYKCLKIIDSIADLDLDESLIPNINIYEGMEIR